MPNSDDPNQQSSEVDNSDSELRSSASDPPSPPGDDDFSPPTPSPKAAKPKKPRTKAKAKAKGKSKARAKRKSQSSEGASATPSNAEGGGDSLLRQEFEILNAEGDIPNDEVPAAELAEQENGDTRDAPVNGGGDSPGGPPPSDDSDSGSDLESSDGDVPDDDSDSDDEDDESSSEDGTVKGVKALSKVLCRLVKEPKKTKAKGKRDIARRMKKYNLLGLDPTLLPNKTLKKILKNPKKLLSTDIFKFLLEQAKTGKDSGSDSGGGNFSFTQFIQALGAWCTCCTLVGIPPGLSFSHFQHCLSAGARRANASSPTNLQLAQSYDLVTRRQAHEKLVVYGGTLLSVFESFSTFDFTVLTTVTSTLQRQQPRSDNNKSTYSHGGKGKGWHGYNNSNKSGGSYGNYYSKDRGYRYGNWFDEKRGDKRGNDGQSGSPQPLKVNKRN